MFNSEKRKQDEAAYWASIDAKQATPEALADAARLIRSAAPLSVEVLVGHIKHLEALLAAKELRPAAPGRR